MVKHWIVKISISMSGGKREWTLPVLAHFAHDVLLDWFQLLLSLRSLHLARLEKLLKNRDARMQHWLEDPEIADAPA
uniref:Uncharacterized protein n=1 Tax=Oryza barthii TaxID=65489 RepID=A0A0D3HCE2_9ORYZ